jgi:hypothetical protein
MSNQDDSGRPYVIGYRKPPQRTQFVKGKSGNPKGRGKGVRNFATEFQEELNTRIPITENGTRKKVTKQRVIVKRVVNDAVSGDPKAIPVVLNQARLHEERSASESGPEILSQPADQLVMANIVKRIREADVAPVERTETAADSTVNNSDPEVGGTS